jgi:hypothetical protein
MEHKTQVFCQINAKEFHLWTGASVQWCTRFSLDFREGSLWTMSKIFISVLFRRVTFSAEWYLRIYFVKDLSTFKI